MRRKIPPMHGTLRTGSFFLYDYITTDDRNHRRGLVGILSSLNISPIDDLMIGFETLVSLITGLDMRLDAATLPACFVIFFRAESEFLSCMTRPEGLNVSATSLMSCVFAAATTSDRGSPLASVIKLSFSYPYT